MGEHVLMVYVSHIKIFNLKNNVLCFSDVAIFNFVSLPYKQQKDALNKMYQILVYTFHYNATYHFQFRLCRIRGVFSSRLEAQTLQLLK